MIVVPKYRVVTPTDEPYMLLWHEDKKLNMQLLMANNSPIVALDIKALPQIIERLVDIYNDIHPNAHIGKEPAIVVEEDYTPKTPGMGEF